MRLFYWFMDEGKNEKGRRGGKECEKAKGGGDDKGKRTNIRNRRRRRGTHTEENNEVRN